MEITPNGNLINNKDYSVMQKKMENLSKSPDDQKLMDACKEFESIFTYMMLKEMKKTVPEDGIIEKSQGTRMFEEMYLEELSKDMANGNNGIGMAKILYNQFKKGNINL